MNYKVEVSENFKREAKKIVRKYPSLKTELADLILELEVNPTKGIALGNDIYKIRLAVSSKNKGKSGGVRVMSFVKIIDTTVLLFSIFSKGEKESITNKEIKSLIKDYL